MIKIKDFSIKTGFSIRMLRYLEEVGILIPKRDNSNYRVFSEEQIDEAKWIKKLQNLGLQLKEIENLNSVKPGHQIDILRSVLDREQEIAEIKSETIPELKQIIDFISDKKLSIRDFYKTEIQGLKKMRTLGGEEKFHRTAYSIPILRNIYEDHLTIDANIELIATDLMKFKQWFDEVDYLPETFSILRESSFTFGRNITDKFIEGYEMSWKKYLPEMGITRLLDFDKEDVSQLMGPHDIVIRSTFKYLDSGESGEIVIPYTPIYTMSQLSNLNK
jgi:DNA-binding transcriptional MerR regulator